MKRREYDTLYAVEDRHWWYLGHRRLYASLLDRYCAPAASGRVLDAGCGTGGFTQWLRDGYHPHRLVGMDISEEALARCGERGLEELLRSSVDHIPLPDASFDLVLSLNVLYHREVADDLEALGEMHRVLVPGGFLLVNLPALSFLRGGHDEAVGGVRRYRASGLREMLSHADFEVVKMTYFVFTLVPLIAAHRIRSRRDAGVDVASDLRLPPAAINRALASLLSIEAGFAMRCGLPLGSSLTALARKG
ncbi:MAG: class I SAM-dependent methyltransferase [Actinomycetota bacterium]|nr:class I SAM-dependent methyltransferase [Actinomycetota bacterium]MDD5665935.1 class I SAM-dependent methyltransferase [Actinomycetota bacterium]